MKRLLLIWMTATLFCGGVWAQDMQFDWASSMGSSTSSPFNTDTDFGYAITTDSDGNIYTTGHFTGSFEGTTLDAGDQERIFVQKLNTYGTVLWTISAGGGDYNSGYDITTDAVGNVYVTGYSNGTNQTRRIFILKLDTNGNTLWEKSIGGGLNTGRGICVDLGGNVYVTGNFRGSADFDTGPGSAYLGSAGLSDIFILKLENGGNYQWASSMGENAYDVGYDIITDTDGNIYVTGTYTFDIDLDPGPGTFYLGDNSESYFIQKLDPNGNLTWVTSFGSGNAFSTGPDIELDSSNNVYATGFWNSDTDVLKLDADGALVWEKSINSSSSHRGNAIAVDDQNNVYTIGVFRGTADFDPDTSSFWLTPVGYDDTFIQKLGPDGNFIWAGVVGGEGQGIHIDSCDVLITGGYSSTEDFDPGAGVYNLSQNGTTEIYVVKLNGECLTIPTCPGDITFNTQQQIDDFPINFPICQYAKGDIIIDDNGTDPISNLNGLSNIISIDGSLQIKNTNSLNAINGLSNLKKINGNFQLVNNSLLNDMNGLSNLEEINGFLEIDNNDALTEYESWANFDYDALTGFKIYNNDNLSLCGIISICLYLTEGNTADIHDNASDCADIQAILTVCGGVEACPPGDIWFTSQADIDNFSSQYLNCTDIPGSLVIDEDTPGSITNLNGLSGLTSVGHLIIQHNSALTSLAGLENLTSLGVDLSVIDNNSLTDISQLSGLDYVRYLRIEDNPALTDLAGLENIATAYGIEIYYNNALTNLDELTGVTTVPADVFISSNGALTNIAGLSNITSINGNLYIGNNGSLTELDSLSLTTVGGGLAINSNYALTNLTGLHNITTIGEYLSIRYSNALTSLSGLDNLSSIGGALIVDYNPSLSNLTGLDNLTTIGEYLYIRDNNQLSTLTGLNNLDYLGGFFFDYNLSIADNPNLSVCHVQGICNLLATGTVANIYDNAPGCNSVAEVEDACIFLPIETTSPFRVYLQNHTAHLTWRTETETNNAGFEVQRSKDGIEWQRIGWQAGQGSTTTPHAYTHIDENPLSGTSYYRFKQVDFDGNFAYSNIADLHYERNTPINVYPNPVQDILYINTELPVQQALVFDISGRSMNVQMTNNTIDVSILPEGIYTLKITIGDGVFYEKILVK